MSHNHDNLFAQVQIRRLDLSNYYLSTFAGTVGVEADVDGAIPITSKLAAS